MLRSSGSPSFPGNPDMVYAMNYGFVDGDHVALSSFRFAERTAEADAAEWWFGEAGLRTTRMADAGAGAFEAGDAFLVGDSLLVADGPRTDLTTHPVLGRELGVRVATVRVVHPALYHLDLSFCPLDERRAIVAPGAWDTAGRATVAGLVPEPLVIDEQEAFTFCANSVVVGDVVVMPRGPGARRPSARGLGLLRRDGRRERAAQGRRLDPLHDPAAGHRPRRRPVGRTVSAERVPA